MKTFSGLKTDDIEVAHAGDIVGLADLNLLTLEKHSPLKVQPNPYLCGN